MKTNTYIYYINEHGEHIPGKVLSVRRRIKVLINDHTGDRITWVDRKSLEVQQP